MSMTGEGEAGTPPRAHWVARRPSTDDGPCHSQETADALMALGGHHHWVLHDCPWPGRPLATIDHIVVGVSGVHVLDSKAWTGDVCVTPTSVTQNGHDRHAALVSVRAQQHVIGALVAAVHTDMPHLPDIPVVPYVVLTGHPGIKEQVDGVWVVSADQVAGVIADQPMCVPQRDVPQLAFRLIEGLDLDRELTMLTLKEARKRGKPRHRITQVGQGIPDDVNNRFLPQRPVRSAMPRSAEKYADSQHPNALTPPADTAHSGEAQNNTAGIEPDASAFGGQRRWKKFVRTATKVAAVVIVVWFIASNSGADGGVTQWLGDTLRG